MRFEFFDSEKAKLIIPLWFGERPSVAMKGFAEIERGPYRDSDSFGPFKV